MVLAQPLPRIVTRVHTADPVYVTNTYTTGTTTVNLPPVEIFVSNGVSYTFTKTESPAGAPTTSTSVYNAPTTTSDKEEPETTTEAPAKQGNTTPAETKKTTKAKETNTPEPTTKTTEEAKPTTEEAKPTTEETKPATEETKPTTTQTPETTEKTTEKTEKTTETTPETTQKTQETTDTTEKPTTTSPETTAPETTTSSTSTSESTPTDSSSSLLKPPYGMVYSPYRSDGGCKDSSTIGSDLQEFKNKGIKHIRTYGTDCGTLSTVLPKCKELGMSVNQGLWMSQGVDSVDGQVDDIINYIKENGQDVLSFITVGNEAVNSNYASVDDLIGKLKSVKSKLQSAGYTGKITTAEPPVTFIKHPELCLHSDIDLVAINPHSYFNTQLTAGEAGDYVVQRKSDVEDACPNMEVKITETGYPSQGAKNGKNVPSKENQRIAIKSILDKTDSQVTILTAFDDFWKPAGPYGIEQYFGSLALFS